MRTATKNFLISSIVAVISLVATNGVLAAGVLPNNHAYVVDSSGTLVRDSSKDCIRTGSWSEEHALVECGDAEAPMAEAAPTPVAAGPKPAAIRATLQTDAFFDFDKAVLKPEGKAKLDDFVAQMNQHQEVDVLLVTGHTDRIGSNSYNMKLSQRRADAVKHYLVDKGVSGNRIETAAKGEEEPVVSCDGVKGRTALIDCLAPNRRVNVETKVQREH